MKIKPEDIIEITSLVSKFVVEHAPGLEDHAKGVSPKRLRWDVFNNAVPYNPIQKRIYAYANDANIDTLLRKIFKHSS